jgi:hypothetical protein
LGEAKAQRNSARQGNCTGAYTEIGAADPSIGGGGFHGGGGGFDGMSRA